MVGMLCDEPWIDLLNDRVEEWSTGLALQMVKAGVDAIWLGEDLGSQTSTLILPEDWRIRFKPRHRRMIGKLRSENADLIIIIVFENPPFPCEEKGGFRKPHRQTTTSFPQMVRSASSNDLTRPFPG
jgi:hypothetical protein